ncbi:MAG: response regulator [Melioribacteraceae bacterium]|nr:response regulator [Melioribacteraceae bacterium]
MLKFLVIDDDENVRMVLRTLLKRRFPCSIFEASNGELGLNAINEHHPDLVFMDITMPVMDGITTLSRIRTNPVTQKLPVMMITALNDKNVIATLLSLGISDYILKPIDVEQSFQRILNYINKLKDEKKLTSFGKRTFITKVNSEPEILLVDNNLRQRLMVSTWLKERLKVNECATGTEALNYFLSKKPQIIIFSDHLNLLDKKIITQKIPEYAKDAPVSIFVMINDSDSVSNKLFVYDGILKLTKDQDSFLREFDKVVLSMVDPLDKVNEFFNEQDSNIRKSITFVFSDMAKEVPNFLDDTNQNEDENRYCAKMSLTVNEEDLIIDFTLLAAENTIVNFSNIVSNLQKRESAVANEIFRETASSLFEKIKLLLVENKYNISWESKLLIDDAKGYNSHSENKRYEFSVKDNYRFAFALSYKKK